MWVGSWDVAGRVPGRSFCWFIMASLQSLLPFCKRIKRNEKKACRTEAKESGILTSEEFVSSLVEARESEVLTAEEFVSSPRPPGSYESKSAAHTLTHARTANTCPH